MAYQDLTSGGSGFGGGEIAEDDKVTVEDLYSAEQLDSGSDLLRDAASDDSNTNDTVDSTTTVNVDGNTATTVVDEEGNGDWAEVTSSGVNMETNPFENIGGNTSEVISNVTDRIPSPMTLIPSGMPSGSEGMKYMALGFVGLIGFLAAFGMSGDY